VACEATIVRAQPLGMRDQTGDDLYALVLEVRAPGREPFRTEVSQQVPATAFALLVRGHALPARRMPDGGDHEVAVDWGSALDQAAARSPEHAAN
jgi:hypothetical protein